MIIDFEKHLYIYDIDEGEKLFVPVKGFEGLYEISNYGEVKSLYKERVNGRGGIRCYPERIMQCSESPNGYLIVALSNNGKIKWQSVHKLVAIHFVKNPFNKPVINHKDTNKLNNFYKNIEWSTHSENTNHAMNNGLLTTLFTSTNNPNNK